MQTIDTLALTRLAATLRDAGMADRGPGLQPGPQPRLQPGVVPDRMVSIWEITTWILPMAAEHLRRVLRQNPGLPQGVGGSTAPPEVTGSTRWFTLDDVAILRRHFAGLPSRKSYGPRRPPGARAPLITLTGPQGRTGRSTAALHLATAAALAGWRVLLIDADPAGQLGAVLGATATGISPRTPGLLALIARSCGRHLRQTNAARLDRGEAPLPVDDTIAAALDIDPASLIRPSRWPGLDIIAASPGLAVADLQIVSWARNLRVWSAGTALADTLDEPRAGGSLRSHYDLILCDGPAGLGPLALAVLTAADLLLVPWLAGSGGDWLGLDPLAQAMTMIDAEASMTARATGQPGRPLGWRRLCVLPIGAALPGLPALQPNIPDLTLLAPPLPHLPQVAAGQATQLYDLDYRAVGRLTYAPLRDSCEAAWQGLAAVISSLWAEDAAAAPLLKSGLKSGPESQ